MSSTTTTQYYGLSQYIGTDKPDWTDNNEAFAEIDADLHGVVQDSEGFSTAITALQEAQSALSTDVTGLESDLNTEKAKITALQNKETLQDAEIAGVKADALDMIAAVDEGTAQVATVAVSEGKYFRYNDVLYIATTNIAVGDTIVPNTNCRATNVGTELEAQAEDIAEVKSDLTTNVLGTTVDITSYIGSIYTFPSDGYVKLHANTNGTNTCVVQGNILGAGSDNTPRATIDAESKAQSGGDRWASLYVKKGMRFACTVTGTSEQASTYFVPIQ